MHTKRGFLKIYAYKVWKEIQPLFLKFYSSKIWDMITWVFVVYYFFEKYDLLKKNQVPQHDSRNIEKNKALLEAVK